MQPENKKNSPKCPFFGGLEGEKRDLRGHNSICFYTSVLLMTDPALMKYQAGGSVTLWVSGMDIEIADIAKTITISVIGPPGFIFVGPFCPHG